jgi:hypothetical protein
LLGRLALLLGRLALMLGRALESLRFAAEAKFCEAPVDAAGREDLLELSLL